MKRWIECPACRNIFQAIRPMVLIHTGTLIEPKLFAAPDGTELGDEYAHPRDIPCYSCGKTAGEIRLATGEYPFGNNWIKAGEHLPKGENDVVAQ